MATARFMIFFAYVSTAQIIYAFISISTPHHTQFFLKSPSHITPFDNRRKVFSSLDVRLLEPIGNGTFGGVYCAEDAVTGQKLVAKSARATTFDTRAQQNAKSYLEIEAYINSKLCPQTPLEEDAVHVQHLAPYLGEIVINQTMYLIWKASGEYTLEDYIEFDNGWVQLANDIGVEIQDGEEKIIHQRFARELLRQLLEGLAYCHSLGVIHRDIKPANVLVDPKTKTLRLIDFGSACDMSGWTKKAGYRGQNIGPRSILYCAPEEFVNEEYPYAFDIYGIAITWLRTVLAQDGTNTTDDMASVGLGDEEQLFRWRISVRDFGHNLISWEEYAELHNTLPYGWHSLFGSSREGIHALRLLSSMMSYSPAQRISASEALLGPYLNADCSADAPPDLPPAMPFSLMSHVQRWKKEKEVQYGECRLEDLFTEVVAVELEYPLRINFQKQKDGRVMVSRIEDDATKMQVQEGDSLLAIGSIDVETASLEHINELLEQWPCTNPVSLLFVRDSD